ncbi:hypothetical protein [Streptomyces sp. NPDC102360]|uniref:hypothetical protein n=1 Tax=Streptomyces sp. NPDC102360 TaxID=3366160 RepID=UPI0037FA309C
MNRTLAAEAVEVLVVLAGLLLWPMIQVGILSLQDYEVKFGGGVATFTGFDHYVELLSGDLLWKTVLPNTAFFAVACVGLTVVLGTAVALLLRADRPPVRVRGRSLPGRS